MGAEGPLPGEILVFGGRFTGRVEITGKGQKGGMGGAGGAGQDGGTGGQGSQASANAISYRLSKRTHVVVEREEHLGRADKVVMVVKADHLFRSIFLLQVGL